MINFAVQFITCKDLPQLFCKNTKLHHKQSIYVKEIIVKTYRKIYFRKLQNILYCEHFYKLGLLVQVLPCD